MAWTSQQQQAISATGNIIVSAAAGSGKTAVLTERIISIVERGTKVTDMLVVTFTKAAAEEMKRRIEKGLYKRADDTSDKNTRAALYAQAQSASMANISTLHAFCMYVMRRHFFEIGISPAFRVADTTEVGMLSEQALNETLEEYFGLHHDTADLLLRVFGDEEHLIGFMKEIYEYMRTRPNGYEWLDNAVGMFSLSADELLASPCIQRIYDALKQAIGDATHNLILARDYAFGAPKVCDVIDTNLDILTSLNEFKDYTALSAALSELKLKGFNGKSMEDKDKFERIKALNNAAKACISDAVKAYVFDINTEADKLKKLFPVLEAVRELICAYDTCFTKKKTDAAIVDFADLEAYTYKLLQSDAVREEMRERFEYVFVDEYQDINPLQDSIINAVSRGNNLFFVGDVKQSIYRFRHAEPRLFLSRLADYADTFADTQRHALNLSANFRSSSAVLSVANEIFFTIMNERTGGIDYDESVSLKKAGAAGEGTVELEIITNNADADDNTDAENADEDDTFDADIRTMEKAEVQARLAAGHIHELMNSDGFFDAKEQCQRKYRFSDFAVIMRKTTGGVADEFARVFALEGIPVYYEKKGGYFDALEVKILLNLLAVLDNRRQDIPLLSVMRSPIGGFEVDEIAQIRNFANHNDLSDADVFSCVSAIAKADTPIGKKAKAFLKRLDEWYFEANICSIEELIALLLNETGYYDYVSALPGGKQRALNLDALKSLAHAFETQSGSGLSAFLTYKSYAEKASDAGGAQDCAADVVRIITAHKSKGLEYNVVILPFLESKIVSPVAEPAKQDLLINPDIGIAMKYTTELGMRDKVFTFDMAAQDAKQALKADEMRLLYVELTRARERLILIMSKPNALKTIEAAAGVPRSIQLKAATIADWILNALCQSDRYCPVICKAVNDGNAQGGGLSVHVYNNIGFAVSDYGAGQMNMDMLDAAADTIDITSTNEYFEWLYPHMGDILLPSKCSVTGMAERDVKLNYYPGGDREKGKTVLSATDRGTATHAFLEHVSLKSHTVKSLTDELEQQVNIGYLSYDEAETVDISSVCEFFNGELGKRLINSPCVLREREFLYRVRAKRLIDGSDSDEFVLLQGVIDCCFIENDSWVIIDYKTDSVEKLPENELATFAKQRHGQQLSLYAKAISSITQKPVKEGYIYFTKRGVVRII